MLKIGLLSDTHHYLDPAIISYTKQCDEIWHAGDFGSIDIAHELQKIAPLRGVYGNIDGSDIRIEFPVKLRFNLGGVDFMMIHIGGSPGRYSLPVRAEIESNPPDIFICGHSHILRICRDHNLNNMLYLNPGAAGRYGLQEFRTMVRFDVGEGKLHNVEVIRLGTRAD